MLKLLSDIFLLLPRWMNHVMEEYIEQTRERVNTKEVIKGLLFVLIVGTLIVLWLNTLAQRDALIIETVSLREALRRESIKVEYLVELTQYQREQLEQPQIQPLKLSEVWNMAPFKITAYAPYDNVSGICNDGNPNSTATGTVPSEGTFAVNPEIIPYFSDMVILYDNGEIEVGQALDTGGALRKTGVYTVDVFRRTHLEARQQAARDATVLWRPQQ